ncbi:hypothetical protein [Actinoplanes siamensis]|uniref:Uncharacterized protein n=1 Tax=Actinoplanes siamensis TaxID=1223317 RepID=A0A919NC06_9ACTN|nr:hypothetical protein [Actinoplanes siamensis]GIF08148.1 hypothetical protein Asi03nite_56860 [Actinoplanes siamensis]
MRFDAPRWPGWRDPRAELRRGLAEGRLPVIGLLDTDGEFSGWETSGDVLTSVTVRYGDARSWLSVQTARWGGAVRLSPEPRDVLKDHLRVAGVRFADVGWSDFEAAVTIDGRELTAEVARGGADWRVARVALDGWEVCVVSYRRECEPRLGTLPDAAVGRMLDAPLADPRRWPQAEPAVEPAEEYTGEPHRGLAEVVLRTALRQVEWLEEGGPAPRLPKSWPRLWRSAIRRQADLAGESEQAAEASLHSMLSHLTSLQSDAGWFREDEGLRDRAINETLLYGTGLALDVPSRAAQEAWREREGTRQAPPRSGAPVRDWLAAWNAWAGRA